MQRCGERLGKGAAVEQRTAGTVTEARDCLYAGAPGDCRNVVLWRPLASSGVVWTRPIANHMPNMALLGLLCKVLGPVDDVLEVEA